MKILLDTCTFIWFLEGSGLSPTASALIVEPANEVYLSAISAWEIGRKYALGKLKLPERPEILIPDVRRAAGVEELALSEEDALIVEKLPRHHKDPSDRMLIAQALNRGMVLVSPDRAFHPYPVRVMW